MYICSQKYHMHWGQMLTFKVHGKSLRHRAGQTCSGFWVTTGGGELEKVFSSPRHLIRPEKIGSCVLHLPFADSPLRSLGNSWIWGSWWECTWGSRWGRRREGECRLAPLLSHEKPQSGCRRLTSNIVRIRYNFSFEPVPIVITTTNPAKKQRVFSNTGCLNRNKKQN